MSDFKKDDIVLYKKNKAKVIGVSNKSGNITYKLKVYDAFNTTVFNVKQKEVIRYNN